MAEIKLEITSRETIKPSNPTSSHLKTLTLSYYDVMTPPVYTGGLLFYAAAGTDKTSISDKTQKLKQSLSDNLTRFYPFAGEINGKFVDCNDKGVTFIEAHADSPLSDLLRNPNPSSLLKFLPDGRPEAGDWPLLLVQATFFTCGGFVIGMCLSHRVCDASALAMFITGWSAAANGVSDAVAPTFTAAEVFPSPPNQETIKIPDNVGFDPTKAKYITKRFVFSASKLKELKNRAMSETVKDPTRFEVITALLWRSATKATRSNTGVSKPSTLQLPLDMRRRKLSPLISEHTVGNIISAANLEFHDPETDIKDLVSKLRTEKKEAGEKLQKKKPMEIAEEFEQMIGEFFGKKFMGLVDGYSSTSWGRSGFYEADLGFGNPIWVTPDSFNSEVSLFVLLDSKDGVGMEAWVSLKKEDMGLFETDPEILEFAVVDPAIEI